MKKQFLVLFCSLIYISFFAQDKERLSLEHYGDYEWTSSPQLSPDGSQVLYSRTWINLVDDKRETDLWIVKSDGTLNRFF